MLQVWFMACLYVVEFLIHALRSPDLDVFNGLKCGRRHPAPAGQGSQCL